MPNECERFATIYAQGHPIGFMITRVMGFEIFDVDERPLAFVYSQREGIEILQRRDVGKWPVALSGRTRNGHPDRQQTSSDSSWQQLSSWRLHNDQRMDGRREK